MPAISAGPVEAMFGHLNGADQMKNTWGHGRNNWSNPEAAQVGIGAAQIVIGILQIAIALVALRVGLSYGPSQFVHSGSPSFSVLFSNDPSGFTGTDHEFAPNSHPRLQLRQADQFSYPYPYSVSDFALSYRGSLSHRNRNRPPAIELQEQRRPGSIISAATEDSDIYAAEPA